MSFPSRPGWPRKLSERAASRVAALVVAAALFGTVAPVPACGPDFPNRYFDLSEEEILAAPEGYFAAEVAHLAGERSVPHHAVHAQADETPDSPFLAEAGEVERALRDLGRPAADAKRVAERYRLARRELANLVEHGGDTAKLVPPADTPEEFRRYFVGAVAWHRGDHAAAAQAWEAVLALPERERRFRSVWAAFMLGRIAELRAEQEGASDAGRATALEATKYFELTRALATEGCHDATGLAAESYGREARAAWFAGDVVRALNRYLDHYAAGADNARTSLRWVAAGLLDQPFTNEVVRDATARRVLTALLVSRVGASPWASDELPFEKWAGELAEACERAGVVAAPEADRLAWLAYEGGNFELAARWADLAPEHSLSTGWIRAKLALRAGDLANGAKFLRAALGHPEASEEYHARLSAELGRVLLAQNDYFGAMRTWLGGGHWQDAAFVAEHILTCEELRVFVDCEAPEAKAVATSDDSRTALLGSLRGLLARRLARTHQYEAALAYHRTEERTLLKDYVAHVQFGFDGRKSAQLRGDAYWQAAQLVREHGMELFGTELEPDWNIWGGYFDSGSSREDRVNGTRSSGKLLAPTADELARIEKARAPKQRYHYRYRAAEIAGWAAALLPNDSADTAHILYTAGGWLKARDPEAANPFYQLLVIRCGNTPLGRAAAAKHWFPDDEDAAIAEYAGTTSAPPAEDPTDRTKVKRAPPQLALSPANRRPSRR